MKALALMLSVPLVGCVVGPSGTVQTGGDDDGNTNTGSGSNAGSNDTTRHISTDTTWSDAQTIDTATVVDAGVTLTVTAGTNITFAAKGKLDVAGTLTVMGALNNTVMIVPATGVTNWDPIVVDGTLNLTYVEMSGGGIQLNPTGTAKIVDSSFSHASGDLIVMNGGTIDMSYSMVGVEPGNTDTTHCDLHFAGTAPVIKVTHSTMSTSSYGVMFYAGMAADFTYNNWIQNTNNVDPTIGQVTGDFSNSFFGTGTAPVGAGLTAATPATARLPLCDGTNDTTCAGPRS